MSYENSPWMFEFSDLLKFPFQMLNIMKGMTPDHGGKLPNVDNEVSLTPMNLSTMLSSHHHGIGGPGNGKALPRLPPPPTDNSLSPRSPRPHQRDLDDDIVDSTESPSRGGSGLGPHGGRARHSSGGSIGGQNEASAAAAAAAAENIKSQLLADLRRLGGHNGPLAPPPAAHIPTNGGSEQQAASSTTHSPPIAHAPPTDENNLPPRKRKVSQEHQLAPPTSHSTPRGDTSPYNGVHEDKNNSMENETVNNSSVDCGN